MLEITCGEMANDTLNQANELYGLFPDSEFVYLELFLAFGDISNLDNQDNRNAIGLSVDVKCQIENLINLVKSYDNIRIWTSKNTTEDYLNMLFALHLITNSYSEKRIIIVDSTKVSLDDKYPDTLAWSLDCLESSRVEKLLNIGESIDNKKIHELCLYWNKLVEINSSLRICENGIVDSVDENFFDKLMLRVLKRLGKAKKSELIGISMAESEHHDGNLSNSFYAYRLEKLIIAERIKIVTSEEIPYNSIVTLA